MKQFLKYVLIEPFMDYYLFGYVFAILMWIWTISVVVVMLWATIWIVDSSFLTLNKKEGFVKNKHFVPSHTNPTFVMVGKAVVPIPNYVNDCYFITVEIDGLVDNVCLHQSIWSKIKIGDKFCFNYTNGRICKTLYIKSFCKK